MSKNPFKRKEPLWDDGTDETYVDERILFKRRSTIALCIYGAISGFIAMQLVQYLAMRFAYYAAGVPFNSSETVQFVVTDSIVNIVFFLLIYVVVIAIGIALAFVIVRFRKPGKTRDMMVAMTYPLMWGLFVCLGVSILMFLVPWNMFMIGV